MKTVDCAFTAGDYRADKKDEGATIDVRATGQTSQSENGHLHRKLENSSSIHTNEELASSRIEMDQLSGFSNLSMEPRDEFTDGNNHSSVTELMNDLTDATNLNLMTGSIISFGDFNCTLHKTVHNL
ncbi:uncharacterized protein A4U43_C05F730 [Asparagus officinalis]|uniref:Uncharacterized protein n=1 Tax=Asparagus officinalis TaxID=4686 RepID=A0A5P1ENZ4_ASPOF|nr:uncharacterized protein A4U43_C05F730 [Asparagus officinalis]